MSEGSSLAPAALFDGVNDLGRLTPNEKVTEAFLSFLGESTETGGAAQLHSNMKTQLT